MNAEGLVCANVRSPREVSNNVGILIECYTSSAIVTVVRCDRGKPILSRIS